MVSAKRAATSLRNVVFGGVMRSRPLSASGLVTAASAPGRPAAGIMSGSLPKAAPMRSLSAAHKQAEGLAERGAAQLGDPVGERHLGDHRGDRLSSAASCTT